MTDRRTGMSRRQALAAAAGLAATGLGARRAAAVENMQRLKALRLAKNASKTQ